MGRKRVEMRNEGGQDGPDTDPAWLGRVREALGAWYDAGHRPLPWRADRDPYRVLVSELMLVQTTAAAVVPFFERFVARFPTVEALAAADEADVLKAWEGLGYYRRARQLHEAARAVALRHAGRVPDELEVLLALPGVGRYIAGAVLSFAYDIPAPIVEANTRRVLARLIALPSDPMTGTGAARLWEAAGRLVPSVQPGRFNQAIMELGATLCAPRGPQCLACPVASDCRARAAGLQDAIPPRVTPPPPLAVAEACAIVRDELGRLLVVRRRPGGLWAGFWEFPTAHLGGVDPAGRSIDGLARAETAEATLAAALPVLAGVPVRVGEAVRSARFGVTKHRVDLTAHAAVPLGETAEIPVPRPGPGLDRAEWRQPSELESLTMSSAQRKLAVWATAALTEGRDLAWARIVH